MSKKMKKKEDEDREYIEQLTYKYNKEIQSLN